MRNVQLVCYDIGDDARLRRVHKTMKGFGDPVQYSVFRCELSAMELQALKTALWELLNFGQDRVMIVDLGPADGRGAECIEYWGEPRVMPTPRSAIII